MITVTAKLTNKNYSKVKHIELNKSEVDLLDWYIRYFQIKDARNQLISSTQAIVSMTKTFVYDVVDPLYGKVHQGGTAGI